MSSIEPVMEDNRPESLVGETDEEEGPTGPESPLDRPDEYDLGAWSETGSEPFGDWLLPGMGEAAPDCGEVSATSFCDEQGHIHYEQHLCGRRECPTCWNTQWSGPRTVNVVSRLAAARYNQPDGIERRAVHAVASPPEGSVQSIEAFYQGRREANQLAKEHGIRGGVVIAHGYRPTKETWERFDGEHDTGIWRWIRANDRGWKEQVYWSPHYHIVGLSEDVEPGDTDEDDGWVFKNIRSLAPYEGIRDREGTEDMVRAVRYLLSHATFPDVERRQAVTWFGSLHGTNFDPEEALSGGSWSVIQRVTEEIVGDESDRDEDELEEDEVCPVEGCEGGIHSIFDARAYLDTVQGTIPDEMRLRIRTAYEWAAGLKLPPPGLKNPRNEEEAREALEVMMSDG